MKLDLTSDPVVVASTLTFDDWNQLESRVYRLKVDKPQDRETLSKRETKELQWLESLSEAFFGDRPNPEVGRTMSDDQMIPVNERRLELIDKRYGEGLDHAEEAELAWTTAVLREHQAPELDAAIMRQKEMLKNARATASLVREIEREMLESMHKDGTFIDSSDVRVIK